MSLRDIDTDTVTDSLQEWKKQHDISVALGDDPLPNLDETHALEEQVRKGAHEQEQKDVSSVFVIYKYHEDNYKEPKIKKVIENMNEAREYVKRYNQGSLPPVSYDMTHMMVE